MADEEFPPCPYCDDRHLMLRCPRVKAFEFDAGGRISRVEFMTMVDYGLGSTERATVTRQ